MQLGRDIRTGKFARQALGAYGKFTGTNYEHTILNYIVYEVELQDGQVKEYATNIIADFFLTQFNSEGFLIIMIEGIINY